jgi:hypothetical protein
MRPRLAKTRCAACGNVPPEPDSRAIRFLAEPYPHRRMVVRLLPRRARRSFSEVNEP